MRWTVIALLIVLYFCYLLVGAAVFWSLEYTLEERRCQETIDQLKTYNLTAARSSNNLTSEDLRNFVQIILSASQNGVQFDSTSTPSCAHNWDYQNAFFFAGTIVTTIGYGNISPATAGGQTFCIIFAAVGLPLFGIMFSAIGDKFAELFKRLDRRMQRKGRNTKLRKIVVILATLTTFVVFCLLIPSVIFITVEDWSYHTAFYYSFITLTTIGLGDYVVGSNPDLTYISIYRIGVYFWILFGLAFMATVVSLTSDLIKGRVKRKKKGENGSDSDNDSDDDDDEGEGEKDSHSPVAPSSNDIPMVIENNRTLSSDQENSLNKSGNSVSPTNDLENHANQHNDIAFESL